MRRFQPKLHELPEAKQRWYWYVPRLHGHAQAMPDQPNEWTKLPMNLEIMI